MAYLLSKKKASIGSRITPINYFALSPFFGNGVVQFHENKMLIFFYSLKNFVSKISVKLYNSKPDYLFCSSLLFGNYVQFHKKKLYKKMI